MYIGKPIITPNPGHRLYPAHLRLTLVEPGYAWLVLHREGVPIISEKRVSTPGNRSCNYLTWTSWNCIHCIQAWTIDPKELVAESCKPSFCRLKAQTHAHTHTYPTNIFTSIFIHITQVCMFIRFLCKTMYGCMHVCFHASMYVRMYAYMHVRMYVCMYIE